MRKCEESDFEETASRRKIFLSKNFRSGKNIIYAVNSVFDTIMTDKCCGINYKEEHRLDFGADFMEEGVPDDKCEFTIVCEIGKADEQHI